MTEKEKMEIASSFPRFFEEASLRIHISYAEFQLFQNGIFSKNRDDKWNVFVLDNHLYLAHSRTNYCIYMIGLSWNDGTVLLTGFKVNRDEKQYDCKNLEEDTIRLKKLLQMFLKKEDFYSDPKMELPLIKKIIEIFDPNNECTKSTGANSVGLTKQIYEGLTTQEQKKYHEIIGWTELQSKISTKSDKESLISLYMQNKKTNLAITYYFDKDAEELLGQIIIKQNKGVE